MTTFCLLQGGRQEAGGFFRIFCFLKLGPWSLHSPAQNLAMPPMSKAPTLCRCSSGLSELQPNHSYHSWEVPGLSCETTLPSLRSSPPLQGSNQMSPPPADVWDPQGTENDSLSTSLSTRSSLAHCLLHLSWGQRLLHSPWPPRASRGASHIASSQSMKRLIHDSVRLLTRPLMLIGFWERELMLTFRGGWKHSTQGHRVISAYLALRQPSGSGLLPPAAPGPACLLSPRPGRSPPRPLRPCPHPHRFYHSHLSLSPPQ